MPLPVIAASETPQQRTCASYKVERLGLHPYLEMRFTETLTDIVTVTVVSATDTDEDEKFDTLVVSVQYSPLSSPVDQDWVSEIVGKSLLKEDESVFGVCDSMLGLDVVLAEGVDDDPTGLVLHYPRINGFGEIVARPALTGNSNTRILSSRFPAQLAKMQEVLGTVAFSLASAVIDQLGLTATPEAIGGALLTMAAAGDNLDSFIVRELETLQESIDAGEVEGLD